MAHSGRIPAKAAIVMVLFLALASQAQVPSAPVLSSPANGAANLWSTVTVSWNGVSGASSYTLQISQSSAFASYVVNQNGIAGNSQILTGFSSNTIYYWRVNVLAASGTSVWSSTWSFDIGSLSAIPTLISPSNNSNSQLPSPVFSWNADNGGPTFSIQISTSASFSTTIINEDSISHDSVTISGLSDNMYYFWRVSAANAFGATGWSSIWSFAIKLNAPSVPVLFGPADGDIGLSPRFSFQWQTASNIATYSIQVSTSTSFATFAINQAGITDYYLNPSDTTFAYSTSYFWRMNASNALGTSPWSSIWRFTISSPAPTAAPVLVSPPDQSTQNSSAVCSWSDVIGATLYYFRIGPMIFIQDYPIQGWRWEYHDTGLAINVWSNSTFLSSYIGDTIKWEVYGYNGGGNGPWSDTFSFIVGSTPVLTPSITASSKVSIFFRNASLSYTLPSALPVELSLYSLLGRRFMLLNRSESPGLHVLSLKNRNLPAGVYFLHFKAGVIERRMKIVLPEG